MNVSFSRQRIAPIVAVVLLGLAWTASAAQAGTKFQASCDWQIIASKGTHQDLIGSGNSSPGGSFTTAFSVQQVGNGDASGFVTLDFANGDTLTYYQEGEWNPEAGLLIGTYVFTGGTGRFEGASGSGILTVDPAGDGTGVFWLDGTISF